MNNFTAKNVFITKKNHIEEMKKKKPDQFICNWLENATNLEFGNRILVSSFEIFSKHSNFSSSAHINKLFGFVSKSFVEL